MKCVFSLFLAMAIGVAIAQEAPVGKRTVVSTKFTEAPVIDGDISDAVWKTGGVLETFFDTANGSSKIDQTKGWIGYDDKAIYVAFEVFDSEPNNLTAKETREDFHDGNSSLGDDIVGITFNGYNQETGMSLFAVNPLGTKTAQIAGGRAKKTEWKGEWVAAAKKTATGWTAELRIPWSILNYPTSKDPLTMRMNFARYQVRTRVESFWSDRGRPRVSANEGYWTLVSPPPPPKPKISALPYILPGFDDKNRGTFRTGVDFRYPITGDLTAVASVNPDFGTVEGAVESISFSRTERFIPERRPFFLEGAGFFQAGAGHEIANFFYSPRIRTFDFGTKVYGKLNPRDSIGLMQTVSFGDRMDVVAKWDRRSTSNEGFNLFVNTRQEPTRDETVVTGNYDRKWGKLNFDGRAAVSGGDGGEGRAVNLGLFYEDRNNFTWLAVRETTPDFRVPDGLINFTGIRGYSIFDEWNGSWRSGYFRNYNVTFDWLHEWDFDNKPFRREASMNVWLLDKHDTGWFAGGTYSYFREDPDRGGYFGFRKNNSNRYFNYSMTLDNRQIGDTYLRFLEASLNMRLFRKLDVGFSTSFLSFGGETDQQILTMGYELSPNKSVGGRMVVLDGETNWYLSYRDSGKKGLETFVILGDPNARKFRRMLQVKFVAPISFG